MKGKLVWLKIFNTDFEEAVLCHIGEEKTFIDEGTDEQNKNIVAKLDGITYQQLFDIYFEYYSSHGMSFSTLQNMFEMLQIDDDWNKVKEE